MRSFSSATRVKLAARTAVAIDQLTGLARPSNMIVNPPTIDPMRNPANRIGFKTCTVFLVFISFFEMRRRRSDNSGGASVDAPNEGCADCADRENSVRDGNGV